MYALREYRRTPKRVADLLPWAALVADDPCVLRNKDGSLQHTLAYQGLDLEAFTAGELQAHAAQLNNVVKRLGTGWGIHVEQANRRVADWTPSTWPNARSEAIDAERRAHFVETPHYQMRHHLTLTWLPPTAVQQQVTQWLYTQTEGHPTAGEEQITTFQDAVAQFTRGFAGCMAWARHCTPAETLTFLHQPISTQTHPIAVPEQPWYLDHLLSDREYVGGLHPALLIGPKPRNGQTPTRWEDQYEAWHVRTLTIHGFPGESYPTMLAHLQTLPLEYRYVCRFLPLARADAYAFMGKKMNLWAQARQGWKHKVLKKVDPDATNEGRPDREAQTKTEHIEAAMDEVAEGINAYGYLTATVTTWHLDPAQADEQLRELDAAMTLRGFTCQREGLNAVDAWLGSLPGHCYANVKRPLLSSMCVAHMLLGSVWTGPPTDTHLQAPALLTAETSGQVPFQVVLHEDGVGHAKVIGPTGRGKTTLIGFMGQQFGRYHALGAQVRLFDKKGTLQPMTQAMGGEDYHLSGTAEGLAFQPLRSCHVLAERQWCASWLEGLLMDQQVPVTPHVREDIWTTLAALAAYAPPARTMTGFMYLLTTEALRQAIRPYTSTGAYGTCLDRHGGSPPLALAPWARFETDALFRVPPLVAPTLSVLFHELEASFTGQPVFLGLDEAWRYMATPLFAGKIEEWLRELRKLNVSVVLSTQDLDELLKSPLYSIIENSCPITIFLPNRRALEPKISAQYAQVGLNDRQIELIAQAVPMKEYLFMSSAGCRIIDLALGPLALQALTGKGV
jgi:type IV secretion/conjugal transfer VirB4 family ATPase